MWIILALVSAFLLGIYDVFKKISLKDNAVIPVLASSIFISAVLFIPVILLSYYFPETAKSYYIYVPDINFTTHSHIFLKAVIVLGSWISAYFGIKHIPITIFSPIRATQPMWTVLGAFIIFSERLSLIQFTGITITIVSFYFFSLAGLKEGISWKNNKWVWLIILATLLGAASGLYDKYLLRQYDRMAVQVYSTFYQSAIMLFITFFLWFPKRKGTTPFQWKWSITGISVFLILADFVYFGALSFDGALISVISTIRRSGAVIPFIYGAIFLHEKNLRIKFILLIGVLTGVILLYMGK
jgi:transporter family protein